MKWLIRILTKLWASYGRAKNAAGLTKYITVNVPIQRTGIKQVAKYFNNEEVKGLNNRLVVLLDQMREVAGTPMIITCGIRSQEDNENVGGVPNSAHMDGLAADIRCSDSVSRYKLVKAAFQVGFKRIEVADRHIHLDISETLPQNVLWIGISH